MLSLEPSIPLVQFRRFKYRLRERVELKILSYNSSNRIQFFIEGDPTNRLDELAFIHLLKMKHGGTLKYLAPRNVDNDESGPAFNVRLQYPERRDTYLEALDTVGRMTDKSEDDYMIAASEMGRVNAADPGRLQAKKMEKLALKGTND